MLNNMYYHSNIKTTTTKILTQGDSRGRMLGVWHHQRGKGDREERDCLPGVRSTASHLHQLVIDGHYQHTSRLLKVIDNNILSDFLTLPLHQKCLNLSNPASTIQHIKKYFIDLMHCNKETSCAKQFLGEGTFFFTNLYKGFHVLLPALRT